LLSAFGHRLGRTARTYLSFIGAPESAAYRRYPVPRTIELAYQARYIGEVRHRDARGPGAVTEVEIHHEEAKSGEPAFV
jgi:hypothetical protein